MTRALVVLSLAASVLSACSYQLFAPPARMVTLESARTAAPGETIVGARAAGYSAVFDPAVGVVSGGVKRGVAEQVEVSADATWGHLVYDGFPDIDRNIYAARVGGKVSNAGAWAAFFAGVGGGVAPAAGGFSAADVGAVLSYPRWLIVPFLNLTGFASTPIGAKQVDFRNPDGTLAATDRAQTTVGLGAGTGIEIPLDWERHRQGRIAPHIQLGLALNTLFRTDGRVTTTTTSNGMTTTTTRDGKHVVLGGAVGLEWPF